MTERGVLKLTHQKSLTITIPRLTAERAVSLLKEQEPKRAEWSTGRAHCPSCGELFPKKKDMTLYTRFCSFCGQKVKWE